MHPSNGLSSSQSSNSTPAVSTLRPRTRRLISVEDDLYAATHGSTASTQASRAASPALDPRTARPDVTAASLSSFSQLSDPGTTASSTGAGNTFSGIWGNSWSAIQGLATNVLGTEAGPKSAPTSTRKRKTLLATHRSSSSSAPPKKWGPSSAAGPHVGAGPQEERESLVRALKRKDLLNASEHVASDSFGRIKRRSSDDRSSFSAPPGELDDRDALIYIHHVRPNDTLAGISIKFSCQPAILRKANRMWSHDSVQTKQTIVIPVDACGIKGQRVNGPDAAVNEDLLAGDWGDHSRSPVMDTNVQSNGWDPVPSQNQPSAGLVSPSLSHVEIETPWKHDSWVLLPNDHEPTQIGRMPRRALGFFPPARRKSITYSDSTPRASVDLPRSSISSNSHASSPAQHPTRPRASSNLSSLSIVDRQRNPSGFRLHGPGGVGTLGKNVRNPGPAQDGLNKMFAHHLPNVEPPPDQEYFTPWAPSLLDADAGTTFQHADGGTRTPLSGGVHLQHFGGAIEGWVRKVGTQASKLLSEPLTPGQGKRSAVPVVGTVGGDIGDLIELRDDAFESGDADEPRGRTGKDVALVPSSEQYQSARPEFNLVLRGRGAKGTKKGD